MKVLLTGSGGREHALYWKIRQSPNCTSIDVLPGNGGIPEKNTITDIDPMDFRSIRKLIQAKDYDFVVVGPEDPLVAGIVDQLEDLCPVFGPSQSAARLEGSKQFSKIFMEKYDIPTASYKTYLDYDQALKYVCDKEPPYVIKTDGLAAGKGVCVTSEIETAKIALQDRMLKNKFGEAGKKVIIEDFMDGEEISVFALCDGKTAIPFLPSQDHKRAYDNDEGPNTGGMGAYTPVPFVTDQMMTDIQDQILNRTMQGMICEGSPYKGLLYAGLMVKNQKAKVVEFNIRFGDPETQALMRLVDDDLLNLLYKSATGQLDKNYSIRHKKGSAIVVVMAGEGYPGVYQKNILMNNILLKNIDNKTGDIIPFHAGTKKSNNKLYSSGGRVLGITGTGTDLKHVRNLVYADMKKYYTEGLFFRTDIGAKGL